jgi:anti-sigma-K factor RskA
MMWHHHPRLVELLAGAYALGTLQGGARRRFEALMQRRPDLADAVARWYERMAPALLALPPQAPAPATWRTIEQRLGLIPGAGAAPAPLSMPWWRRWLQPAPAGALVLGLMVGVMLPALWQGQRKGPDAPLSSQLPESYVGVLGLADGRPGLIVSSLRQGRTVDIKRVAAVPVPAGQVLYLWAIDAAGQATPVAPLPTGAFVHLQLDAPAETMFAKAVELAVSLEREGMGPVAPAGPYVYRGLCGKLWRVP